MVSAKKSIVTALKSALFSAAFLAFPAFAATPAAVWDGDFTAMQTGFTLDRNGNAISQDNSTITIDQSVGMKVDFTTGFSDAMTVIFKYSDLSFNAQKTLATSFCSGGDENRTGVYLASGESSGTVNGIWNTADWAHPAQTLSASSGVLAFCYSKTGGTSLYSVGASSRSELFNRSDLKAGGDTAINGCTIGGERAKSGATLLSAATGMKITGIAIFDSILTEAEMTNYDFPSEIQEYTLSLDGAETNWRTGEWKIGTESVAAPLSGYVTINLSASTTLTIDETVALKELTVQGEDDAVLTLVTDTGCSLVANVSTTVKSGVLKQGSPSVLGATPKLYVEDGATFDLNGFSISRSTAVYIAGEGAGSWPWALTSSSGAGGAILGGLYLTANATIGGANELKIGQADDGYYCYLQGFTLTKAGEGAFTATNMNTPKTGTIDVQGGAMSVNKWNNLNSNSGDTDVILRSGTSLENKTDRVISMRTLTLDGGTLLTTSNAFKVKTILTGKGETAKLSFAAGATINLTGELRVTDTLTLDGSLTISTAGINPADIAVGQTINLLTAPSETTLSADAITVKASSRYDTAISGNTITATFSEEIPQPFLHYDFNNGAAVNTGKADDSRTQIASVGEASSQTLVNSRNGKAVCVCTGYTPYWDSNNAGVSPFAFNQVTVTTVAKMKETGVVLWGLGAAANNTAMGLVVLDANTVAVVAKNGTPTVETLVSLTGTADLTKGYHFYAVVANAAGTTLYVDDLSQSSDKVVSAAIGQHGQLGSFHGGAIGGKKVGADGYLLDDWRVYDAALTAAEIGEIRNAMLPTPFIFFLK